MLLYACLNGRCTVVFFKTKDGRCATCGEPGFRVAWAVRPPQPPPDEEV